MEPSRVGPQGVLGVGVEAGVEVEAGEEVEAGVEGESGSMSNLPLESSFLK